MTVYEKLSKRIAYAKTSIMPRDNLHMAKGMIDMAYELKAITIEEFLALDKECVAKGINNPKYF